jgi:NADPH2:quinone reductase
MTSSSVTIDDRSPLGKPGVIRHSLPLESMPKSEGRNAMKAWQVRDWCAPDDMELTEIAEPEPGPGQCLVRVEAASLNFFDILMIAGKYQMRPPFPFTPGSEIAGEVVKAGTDSKFQPGDRVCAQVPTGAFAEFALCNNDEGFPVPDGVPATDAAVVPVVYGTAHMALGRRANLQAGEWLLVTAGAGGVGLAAIQIGRAWGARVIALASSEEKRTVCRDNGAELALDYSDDSWVEAVREHTQGHGGDVIFDPVGGDVFNLALKVIAWEGRAVIIGFAGGDIQQIASNRLLLKNASAVGAFWGRYYEMDPERVARVVEDCMALYQAGKIKPVISSKVPLEQVPEALNRLAARGTYGKIVIEL